MKKIAIVAKCDAYNARRHHHGEPILESAGPNPVRWLESLHDDMEGAKEALSDLADDCYGRWCDAHYVDEAGLLDTCRDILDDPCRDLAEKKAGIVHALDTWKGEGWYHGGGCCMYQPGDMSFQDDVVTYSIEELELESIHVGNVEVCRLEGRKVLLVADYDNDDMSVVSIPRDIVLDDEGIEGYLRSEGYINEESR